MIYPTKIFKLYSSFYNFAPKRNFGILATNLFYGLNQGISIVALVPLLQMLDKTSIGGNNRIVRILESITANLGITVNIEVIICLYLILLIFNALLSYFKTIWQNDVQQDYTAEIRNTIFARLIQCDWLYLSGKNRNEFSHILTSEIPRITALNYFLLSLLSTLIIFIIHLAFALYISLSFTAFVLISGLILYLLLNKYIKKIYIAGQDNFFTNRNFYKQFDDFWDTIKLAKIHGTENLHHRRINAINYQFADERKRMVRLKNTPQTIIRISSALLLSTVVYIGFKYGDISLSVFFILILLFARIFPQLMKIQTDYMQIIGIFPAYDNSMKLKKELDEILKNTPGLINESSSKKIKINNRITFKDVSFAYTGSSKALFNKLNCFIPAQKLTGIIGASGIGKTSMIDMIAGLIKPLSGDIIIDEINLNKIDNADWHKSIAYVPQDSLFTNSSIRDNLCMGNTNISEDKIWKALKQAKAYDFMKNIENGLDAKMNNNAQQFSGGERQRIAIVRALLREPTLLLLDEITSSLDSENEQNIMNVLTDLKEKITIVMITHKKELCSYFDNIIELG
jgi:ATP-binding cassette subfamily C protein